MYCSRTRQWTTMKPKDSQTKGSGIPSKSSGIVVGASSLLQAAKTGKKVVQIYLSFSERYNHFMKLLLTILLGLLLVQAVVGLHLHTEGEEAGNTTATVDANATASNKSEEDEQLQTTQKNYDAIEASGDEELIAAAKEARASFEAAASETKEKVESYAKLSENPTDQERLEALGKIQAAGNEFKEALDSLTEKLEELKKKLDEKQANTGAGSD